MFVNLLFRTTIDKLILLTGLHDRFGRARKDGSPPLGAPLEHPSFPTYCEMTLFGL